MEIFRVSDPALQEVLMERMFVWKRHGKLAVLDWGGYRSRNEAMSRLLELADDSYGLSDFGPVTISTSDRPVNTDPDCVCLSFSAAEGYHDVVIPDFTFYGWPEVGIADFAETTWEVADAGASEPERPTCGWIGDPRSNERRYKLIELSQRRPDLLDASGIDWTTDARIPSPGDAEQTLPFNYLTLPQQVSRWGSLIDIEGRGYSARLKILFHSGRPVFVQERPWQEWYFRELRPMRDYIPVRDDLSDLVEKLEWVRDNPDEAAQIGRAGQAFAFAKLTREAAVLQLVQTIERVAREHQQASYAAADLREPLDPVLERLGAFA